MASNNAAAVIPQKRNASFSGPGYRDSLSQPQPQLQQQQTPISDSNNTTESRDGGDREKEPSIAGTGSKRRRIALACSACRGRKSRCDGNRPKCSACEELSFDCVYVQSASSNNIIVGKEYLLTIEARLLEVEKTLTSLKNERYELSALVSDPVTRRAVVAEIEASQRAQDSARDSSFDDAETGQDQGPGALRDGTDGMGAIVFTDEEDCGFFGPSSNIAFTRHISRAVARISNITHSTATPGTQDSMPLEGGMMNVSRPLSPVYGQQSSKKSAVKQGPAFLYDLPPEAETLALVRNYFNDTGLLFPYIHEETFFETYEEMKRTNFRKIRRTWLALLNMVLALSSSTIVGDMNAEKRAETSDVFYQRALGLCDKQIMRGTSLEVVQSLLLMGQYLQGTQKPIQTWTIHGLAVKAAFQLGLHSSEALRRLPPLEREIRKRTWYGCVILDRTLSMTFGRPAAIPEDYVKLELPCAFDLLLPGSIAPDTRAHNSLCFYNATITLYRVMWKVIDLLYGGNIGCDGQPNVFDTVARLFQMEQQLVDWRRLLPPNMQLIQSQEISSGGEEPGESERFRIILTLRYHNLRILIHRLILVKFLDMSGKNTTDDQQLALLQQIGSNSVQICVQSSNEIISIVNLVVHAAGARRTLLGAWWFSLYYTSTNLSRSSLNEAVEALRYLDHGNRMVEKCGKNLRQLGYVLDSLSSNNFFQGTDATLGLGSQLDLDQQAFESFAMTTAGLNATNQSPLGMDLGEFMMEGDLEFLNHFSVMSNGIGDQRIGMDQAS